VAALLAGGFAAFARGCGSEGSSEGWSGPSSGASGGVGGQGAAAGDASVGGEGQAAASGTAGGAALPDAKAGSGGAGGDAAAGCKSDNDCAGKPATPHCVPATGQCVECTLADPTTCKPAMYCNPATLTCASGCDTPEDCNAGDAGPITCDTLSHKCNPLCVAGQFHCECNEVQQCDPGPPAKWVSKSPAVHCNAASGQACDPKTGTCKALATIGGTTPTGTYYRYANFTASNSPLKISGNVDDVDSYGDYIYVNRGPWYSQGIALDVYKVTLIDSDGDGKLEPNQHPDNPADKGPIEQRVLAFVATYTTAAPDNAPMGIAHRGEMLAVSDRIFTLGPKNDGDITEYIFATKTSNVVAHSTAAFPLSQMGFGDQDKTWYGSHEGARRVYSYCPSHKAWVAEFQYPNLAGSHMDGLEVIVSVQTKTQYVYVSDMTSDFLGQYRRDGQGGWVQENLFKYVDPAGANVEGMGFGAFCHLWMTSGNSLYEIGGGDLTSYLSDKSCQ
jgi:hypothetical protein